MKVDIRADYFAVHAPKGKRPYVRVGNTTREVSMEGLGRLMARRGALVSADERPVLEARWADLDHGALANYHQRRFGHDAADLERFTKNLKLLVDDDLGQAHPSIAGMLLFGKPSGWYERYETQVIVYSGDDPDTDARADSRRFNGTIPSQVADVMTYLRTSAAIGVSSSKTGVGRVDTAAYSERALQEAIVNALAHRDYAVVGPVRIQVFQDRIAITNPGRLPNSLQPDDLFAGAQPVRRNQVIVGFLMEEATWPPGRWAMDGSGEGFLTIVRETERLAGHRPTITQQTEAFTLVIPRSPI